MIEKDLAARNLFRLSDERKIQIHSVKSDNEEVNFFLKKRLENKVLTRQSVDDRQDLHHTGQNKADPLM